jgi:two-component system CitB family sensor kinase
VRGGDQLTVEVTDTGPGVPAGADDAIWGDGFSTKPPTEAGRRGLGLAIVHREVRRLGGTVSFTTGPGATFTVVIPARVDHDKLAGARP